MIELKKYSAVFDVSMLPEGCELKSVDGMFKLVTEKDGNECRTYINPGIVTFDTLEELEEHMVNKIRTKFIAYRQVMRL